MSCKWRDIISKGHCKWLLILSVTENLKDEKANRSSYETLLMWWSWTITGLYHAFSFWKLFRELRGGGGGIVAPIPAKGRPSDVFIRHVVYLSILPPSQILREVKAPYSSSMQCSLSEWISKLDFPIYRPVLSTTCKEDTTHQCLTAAILNMLLKKIWF